jgi:hypothetical protein
MKKQKWEESEKRRERVRRKGQPETCATPGKSATGLRGCRRPRKSKEVITSSNSSSLSPWSYLLKHNVLQLCDTLKCLYPIPFWWATKTGSEKAKPHANRVWKKYEWRISGLNPDKKNTTIEIPRFRAGQTYLRQPLACFFSCARAQYIWLRFPDSVHFKMKLPSGNLT